MSDKLLRLHLDHHAALVMTILEERATRHNNKESANRIASVALVMTFGKRHDDKESANLIASVALVMTFGVEYGAISAYYILHR